MDVNAFYDQYVDEDKFYTIKELEVLMEKFSEVNGGNVPGGPWLRLTEKLGSKMVMSEQIYKHFGEADMLTLIKSDMDPIFAEFDYKNNKAPLFGHTYQPIQNILTRCAQVGYTSIFKYMVDNVCIENYDIDRLNLLIAIQNNFTDIVELIVDNVNENNYGFSSTASFVPQIQAEILKTPNLQTLPQSLKDKMQEKFNWIKFTPKTVVKKPLNVLINEWSKMSDSELDSLVLNGKNGKFSDKEFEALENLYIKRLEDNIADLKRQLEAKKNAGA